MQNGAPVTPLAGRTALVAGASGSLGCEIARALATAGAHVLLHGRQADRLIPLAKDISDARFSAQIVVANLRDSDAAIKLLAASGSINMLVSNAADRDRRVLRP
jgi:gluconate 5-dehydrogenase